MLEWVIIGGGVIGTHLAYVLATRGGVAADALRVVDAAGPPLTVWRSRTAACAMDFLRSPQVHHLGARSDALRRFAAGHGFGPTAFTAPYLRPSLALFDAHCSALLGAAALADVYETGRVLRIRRCGNDFHLEGANGRWKARRVILATGPKPPARPAWAAGVPHVFDPNLALPAGRVAVVGAGVSGGQLALRLAKLGRQVELFAPRGLRIADFDAPPRYAGQKGLRPFALGDWRARRVEINAAHQPGTLPRDVAADLRVAIAGGNVRLHSARVAALTDAGVRLASGRSLAVDSVILATGFAPGRPGGALVDQLVDDYAPPLAPCGFPAVNTQLEWLPGLHVAGGLAELELGPMAANIRGARMAAERLLRIQLLRSPEGAEAIQTPRP